MKQHLSWAFAMMGLLAGAGATGAPADTLPPIGTIDFFGLRRLSEAEVRRHLPFKEGDEPGKDPLLRDGSAIARSLGVAEVTLAYICCTPDQKLMSYVGVAEQPVPPARSPAVFTGDARLDADMMQAEAEFEVQLMEAVKAHTAEDHSQGHALSTYSALRAVQEKFIGYARDHTAQVTEVLATASDPKHRALAAMILGYAPDKRAAASVLAPAVLDPDRDVRNNAARAIGVIAEYAGAHPELGIHIDADPFVALLNSMVWSDRNKGIMVLTQLTAAREPALLQQLRKTARSALIDMCGWKNPGHSIAPCLVLRRVEGLPDFGAGDSRAEVLQKVGAGRTAPPG